MRIPQAQQEKARLLYGGRWQPVTKNLTFIEGSVDDVVDSFVSWRGLGILQRTGHPVRVRTVHGDLEGLLGALEPLNIGSPRRYLFVPTVKVSTVASAGPWVCVLENVWSGTDPGASSPFVGHGFRAVSVESAPSDLDMATNIGGYGIHHLGVYWPDAAMADTPSQGVGFRSVGIAQFESLRRWDFVNGGPPLPFEDTSRYTARRVRDRFTQQMLIDYAAALGLRPFDPDFYAPDHTAVMVEHTDPPSPGLWEVDLAGARSGKGYREVGRPATR